MKITIDTNKDSEKEIKKAIKFLQELLNETAEQKVADVSEGAFNIFNNPPEGKKDEKEKVKIMEY